MKIEMGFVDVSYGQASSFGRNSRRTRPGSTMTTARLAPILEAEYGIVNYFLEHHGEEVIYRLIQGYMEQKARPASGTGSRTDYVQRAFNDAQEMFKQMLDNRELDGLPGVPTQASILGVRRGRRRSPGRPSFVDTGLYRDSFRISAELEGSDASAL